MYSSVAILNRYGALELKRAYQRNLIIGILTASLLSLAAIGIVAIFSSPKPAPVVPIMPIDPSQIKLGPPPTVEPPVNQNPVGEINRTDFSAGVPVPVPDEQAPEETYVPTQDDLSNLISNEPIVDWTELGNSEIIISDAGGILPPPDTFIAYEEAPQIVDNINPIYPPMAQRAGLEAIVWINVLIDRDGKVRDVKIVKSSDTNAGFEEAAVEAAYKTTWKPAISNGQAVAVWTTYRIIFELRK
jgi:TonB family protein